ncbi:hypothetical protein [Corynebacterium matruchotii]|nr:hypothetical protein [Corynebacterium matruchotii]
MYSFNPTVSVSLIDAQVAAGRTRNMAPPEWGTGGAIVIHSDVP